MSNDIKVLKEIGLKEVSRKTYIEVKYLQRIVDKDFANLNRANTLGFIKILKREYNLDLDEWVKEFEEYLKENANEAVNEQLFVDTRPSFWQNKLYLFLIAVFIILLGGFLYSYFYNKNSSFAQISDDNTSAFMQAVENIGNITDENLVSNTSADTLTITNQTLSDNIITDNSTNELSNLMVYENMEDIKNASEKALLKPSNNLWIGIIDLSNFQKKDYIQNSSLEIDLTKEQLILAGHGNFKIENKNGENLNFNSESKKYLHVKNGAVKEINAGEFRSLNRGRDW